MASSGAWKVGPLLSGKDAAGPSSACGNGRLGLCFSFFAHPGFARFSLPQSHSRPTPFDTVEFRESSAVRKRW